MDGRKINAFVVYFAIVLYVEIFIIFFYKKIFDMKYLSTPNIIEPLKLIVKVDIIK